MRKIFATVLFYILFSSTSFSQGATIKFVGTHPSGSHAIHDYQAFFFFPFSDYPSVPTIQWIIGSGGVIESQNVNPYQGTVSVSVYWPNGAPYTISVNATDSKGLIQTGTLTHDNIVSSSCWTNPISQQVYYGQVPLQIEAKELCLSIGQSDPRTYQWQEADTYDLITQSYNWTNIIGNSQSMNYQPGSLIVPVKYYRRAFIANNQTVYTDPVSVSIIPFSPGTIYASSTTIPYNTLPAITATYAGGNLDCNPVNLSYWWEYSVVPGVWTNVGGSTPYFPTNLPTIKGLTKIRRAVQFCGGGLTYYSNVLEFNSTYTSVNVENRNYVRVNSIVKEGIYSWEEADALPIGDKFQSTTYFDGLGRTTQQVGKEVSKLQSGQWADMVTHIEYDAASRIDKSFIAYPSSTDIGRFKSNAKAEQESFIRNKYSENSNAPTYNKSELEQSPLSRITNWKAAGTSWGGNVNYTGITSQYEYNTLTEGVRRWKIDFSTTAIPQPDGVYSEGVLAKSISIDEKGKKTYTYVDLEGNVVLKKVQDKDAGPDLDENGHNGWLCTYYVYDEMGQQRSIITPKAVKYLLGNSWTFISTAVYQELCFFYEYDERGRMVIKHSPGAGENHIVYDSKDRPVLLQDQNQRDKSPKQWSFFLYDSKDRAVATGLYTNNADRVTMAEYVKALNNGIVTISVYTGSNENIIVDNPVAGSSNYCNSCQNTVYNSVSYYDHYDYPGAKPYNTNFSFFGSTNDPSVKSLRTIGVATGSKGRVINDLHDDNNPSNDTWLVSTGYIDEKGRSLQGLTDNIKGGVDYSTNQYDYTGKVLSVHESHTVPNTAMNNFQTIAAFIYNNRGQLLNISRKYGAQGYKSLVSYSYDEYGRLMGKKLSPNFNSDAGIEDLVYKYNIQGSLVGINEDYALSTSALAQWDHYFGIHLGYDNRHNKFAAAQYNGNITGVIWKTQGDNMPRKYDYQYDNANRFKAAFFTQKQKPSDASWLSNKMDFSVTDITYDENSNLTQMYQKGVIPGKNSPVFIDKLVYEYKQVAGGQWSNQLRKVFDQTTDLSAANNGALGDFKDENYGVNDDDYVYDGNGSLVKDNNKKIRVGSNAGITYNFMGKPQKIVLENKSEVEFIYDAGGGKIGKKVKRLPSNDITYTWYFGSYIYEEAGASIKLKYILHEEGRIRIFEPANNPRVTLGGNFDLPGTNTKGVFDYFISDHLGSTRMIVTEEDHSEINNCTMETANAALADYERKMFGQVDPATGNPTGNNEVNLSREDRPQAWSSNSTSKVSKLGQDFQRVGPNMILKVMAGDLIHTQTDYFYNTTVNNTGAGTIFNNVLSSLIGAISGSGQTYGPVKNLSVDINSNLTINPGDLGDFINNQTQPGSTTPQAYLNVVFFDENFNFIPYDVVTGLGSYAWRVENPGNNMSLSIPNIKVPKNGYAYIYLSNDSKTIVYFDNFVVTHQRGRIVEENAYYPYGLKIAGISARAFDKSRNDFGYQGAFSEMEEETGWNEFDLRMYNSQIGVWSGVDPFDQFASPYIGMGNNPVSMVDINGGEAGGLGAVIGAFIGFGAGYGIAKAFGEDNLSALGWGLLGSGLGAGIGYGIGAEGPFFLNFRAFYEGLIGNLFGGDDGWVHAPYDHMNTGIGYVATPNIWGCGDRSTARSTRKTTSFEVKDTRGVGGMAGNNSTVSNPSPSGPTRTKIPIDPIDPIRSSSGTTPGIIPPPSHPRFCACGTFNDIVGWNPIPRLFTRPANDGEAYIYPQISDDQFNAVQLLGNDLASFLRPGDVVINATLFQNYFVFQRPVNDIPVLNVGGPGPVPQLKVNSVTGRRSAIATRIAPMAAGNTIWQNFTTQTTTLAAILSRRFGGMAVGVIPTTTLIGTVNNFQLNVIINRPIVVTRQYCTCW